MDRDFNGQIIGIAGEPIIRKLYAYARSHPIVLPPIIRELDLRVMEELLRQNKSKHFIARFLNLSVRTVERWIAFLRCTKK